MSRYSFSQQYNAEMRNYEFRCLILKADLGMKKRHADMENDCLKTMLASVYRMKLHMDEVSETDDILKIISHSNVDGGYISLYSDLTDSEYFNDDIREILTRMIRNIMRL